MTRLGDELKSQEFWESLNGNEKLELMEDWYPDHAHLLDLDDMWRGLDLEDRIDIWKKEIGYDEVNVSQWNKGGKNEYKRSDRIFRT